MRNAILDKNVEIADEVMIGVDHGADRARFTVSDNGVVVVGKNVRIELHSLSGQPRMRGGGSRTDYTPMRATPPLEWTMDRPHYRPVDAALSPRFVGIRTFMRLPS